RDCTAQWRGEANKLIDLQVAGKRQDAFGRMFELLPVLGERAHQVSGNWLEHNERLAREGSRSTVTTTREARWKWWAANVLAVAVPVPLGFCPFPPLAIPTPALVT